MKIWQSYGSEHSMNLVMIGKFKSSHDAEETKQLIDSLSEELADKVDINTDLDRFNDDVFDILRSKNVFQLGPQELAQFLYDISVELHGDEIRVTTDEDDVSAIQKLMLHKGAKIEVFSAHDYQESENQE
jgi:uncharacterized protein DUF6375